VAHLTFLQEQKQTRLVKGGSLFNEKDRKINWKPSALIPTMGVFYSVIFEANPFMNLLINKFNNFKNYFLKNQVSEPS
jgi:hypothetical protein